MKAPKSDKDGTGVATAAAKTPSVDQIRDLIFGAQMQDYEARFDALEQRLLAEAEAIRKDLRKTAEDLGNKLDGERQTRERQEAEFLKKFENRVNELVEHAARDRESLEQRLQAARDEIGRELAELTHDKTDRVALSSMLRDLASELENGSSPQHSNGGDQ